MSIRLAEIKQPETQAAAPAPSMPDERRSHWDKVFLDPEYFDSIAKQPGIVEGAKVSMFGEDYAYRAAMIGYLSDSRQVPLEDMRTIYDAEKDSVAQKEFGKPTISSKELFEFTRKKFERDEQKRTTGDAILQEVIKRGLMDSLGGGNNDHYKDTAADIEAAGDLFDEQERFKLQQAADRYDMQIRQATAKYGEDAKWIFSALQQKTGVSDGATLGAPGEVDMTELAARFADMPDNQQNAIFELVGMFAKLQKTDKGFFYQLAESLGRGVGDFAERIPRNWSEAQARGDLRLLESGQPVFRVQSLGGGQTLSASGDTPLTAEEVAAEKAATEKRLRVFKVQRRLRELAETDIDPLKTVSNLPAIVEEGLYGAARSLPYTVAAALPVLGPPTVAAAIYSQNYDGIMLDHPEIDPDKAALVALASAPIEAALERLQVNTIMGRLPIFGKLVQRLKNPRQRLLTRFMLSATGVVAEQNAQEIVQNSVFPVAQMIAAAIDEDMPGYNLREGLESAPRALAVQFVALLPLSLLGLGGVYYREVARGEDYLKNSEIMAKLGADQDGIDRVLAETTPEARQAAWKEVYQAIPQEQREAAAAKVVEEIVARKVELDAQANPANLPRLEKQGADYTIVSPTGEVIYRTGGQDSAELMLGIAQREAAEKEIAETTRGITEAVSYLTAVNTARQQGEDVQKIQVVAGKRNLFDEYQGDPTTERFDSIRAAVLASTGQDVTEPEQLRAYWVDASNSGALQNGVYRSVISIFDGADGTKVIRDFAQDNLKRAIAEGRVDMAWVREQLNQTIPLVQGSRADVQLKTETDNDVIESFSDIALAFLYGRVKRDQVAPGLRGFLVRMARVVRDIFRRAYNLEKARVAGQLSPEWQGLLAEAVGIDSQGVVDAARQQASDGRGPDGLTDDERAALQAELDAEMEAEMRANLRDAGGVDILDAIKQAGGLPSATSRAVGNYAGELKILRENAKGGRHTGVTGTSLSRLFKKDAPDLDNLIRDLRGMGFLEIETPSDVFEMVERRIATGKPIYGYEGRATAGMLVGNYSVSEGEVGPYPSVTNYSVRLSSVHNLSEENLAFADKMGGLAVPSIAIVPAGRTIEGFGNITLIGGRELGDPAKNPVYDADAYTQRFPAPEYKKAKSKDAQKLVDAIRPFEKRFESNTIDYLWDNAVNRPKPDETISRAKRDRAVKAYYLSAQMGVEIDPIMREISVENPWVADEKFQEFANSGGLAFNYDDEAKRKAAGDAVRSAITTYYAKQLADIPDLRDSLIQHSLDRFIDESGQLLFNTIGIERSLSNLGKMQVDGEATDKLVNDALNGHEPAFYQWIEETIYGLHDAPRIKVGGKWEPYTLDNIVRVMTAGRVKGQEQGMTFGEGKARAETATRFKSLEQMRQAAETGIKTEEEVKADREKNAAIMDAYRQAMLRFYKYSDTWSALDDSMQVIADYLKGPRTAARMQAAANRRDFENVSPGVIEQAMEAAAAFRDAPVPYFESKPQRVVALSEFEAAAIPRNASPQTVEILQRHGIRVAVYDNEQGASLESAVNALGVPNYSISSQQQIERVNAALSGLNRGPEMRAKVYERARDKFQRMMQENWGFLFGLKAGGAAAADVRRTKLLQAMGELDAILSILPPEVRGKVPGHTKLAQIKPVDVFKNGEKVAETNTEAGGRISAWMREGKNIGEAQKQSGLPKGYTLKESMDGERTDKALADFFISRINMIDRELERVLRREWGEAATKLFQRAKPQRNQPGQKPKGKFGYEVHDLFRTIEDATEWTEEKALGHVAGLWQEINSGELSAEAEAHKSLEAELVPLFANWANADAGRMANAITIGNDVLTRAYRVERDRIMRLRTQREIARFDLTQAAGTSGDLPERQAQAMRDNSLPGTWRAWMLNLLNFDQVVSYVFGENAPAVRQLVERQRAADNAKTDGIIGKTNRWQDFITKLAGGSNLSGQKLVFDMSQKNVEIKWPSGQDGKTYQFSQNELLTVTMMWMQPRGREHMLGKLDDSGEPIGSWHYNQDFVNEAEKALTPEARAIRDYLLAEYDAEYNAINDVYRRVFGINLPKEKNYSPLTVNTLISGGQAGIDPVTGAAMAAGARSPGALKSRGGNVAEPRFADAVQTYFAHTLQMEHWKAYAEFNADMSSVLNHRNVRNAIEAKTGQAANVTLGTWLQHFNEGGSRDAASHLAITQGLNKMLGRFATMALFGRVSTLALQSTQLAAASAKMPVGAYLSRLGKLLSGRLSWGDALNSPYIQRRIAQMPPQVQLAMQGLNATEPTRIKEAARRLGQLISGFDGLFTAGTYAMVLDYQRSQGATEEQARAEAERITDEIAQPTRAGARSIYELTSTHPLTKAAWAFASEPRKNLALTLFSAAGRTPREFAKAAIYMVILNGLISSVIRAGFRDLRDDEDDEVFDEKNWRWQNMAAAMVAEPIYGIPVIGEAAGKLASSFLGVWTPSGGVFDVTRAGGAIRRAPDTVADLLSGDADWGDVARDVNAVLTAMGLFNDQIAGAASISNLVKDLFQTADAQLGPDE